MYEPKGTRSPSSGLTARRFELGFLGRRGVGTRPSRPDNPRDSRLVPDRRHAASAGSPDCPAGDGGVAGQEGPVDDARGGGDRGVQCDQRSDHQLLCRHGRVGDDGGRWCSASLTQYKTLVEIA